jgi:predicted flap endonuclease-1-like 5' DNA nuclease
VAWFSIRSLVTIVPAFVLGLAVGWWWWRRRKFRFGESQAISQLTASHRTRTDELTAALARKDDVLARKDKEIARLRVAVEAVEHTGASAAAGASGVSSGSATWRGGGAAADPDGGAAADPDGGAAATEASATAAALVTEPTEPSPQTLAALATPVEDLRTEKHQSAAPVPEFLIQTPATGIPAPAATPAAEADRSEAADADGSSQDASEEDDLLRVEGIGPRIGAALRDAGIHTFRELAEADTATLQGALEKAGLRFAPTLPTWSRQAALLADGDEEGFQQLTRQLAGGRDAFGGK